MRRHVKASSAGSNQGRSPKLLIGAGLVLLVSLLLGVTIASATAPVVTIDPGPTASYTTAHVSGTVNPEDQETNYYFQYSKDPGNEGWSSGNSQGPLSPGSGEANVSDTLTGLKSGTQYFVRLVADNSIDPQAVSPEPNPTFTTDPVPPASVSVEAPIEITGTSVRLKGKVNPGGTDPAFNVFWRFVCTPECPGLQPGTIDADTADHFISAEATGLVPNADYEVTLFAERFSSNAGPPASAGPEGFKTAKVPPDAQTLWAGSLGPNQATLGARINPYSSPVTYQFEWGAETSYDHSAPVAPVALGVMDGSFHVATAPISGLQPGTTYHYRVVATNTDTAQTDEGEDRTFTTPVPLGPPAPCANAEFRQGPSASLPDCRAYEQVSPVDKNGFDVLGNEPPAEDRFFTAPARPISTAGDAAIYQSAGSFAGNPTGGGATISNFYLARRGSEDWSTTPAMPRGSNLASIGTAGNFLVAVASDLSVSLISPLQGSFDPDPPTLEGTFNVYQRQNFTGQTKLVFRQSNEQVREGEFAGSSDLSHFAFTSPAVLVDDPNIPQSGTKVYEYTNGEIRLVSRQPGTNEPFAEEASLAGRGAGGYSGGQLASNSSSSAGAGAVSADGRQIFFETPPPSPLGAQDFDSNTQLIYRRSNGTSTALASPSRRVPVDPEGPKAKYLLRTTPDGNRVFFRSAELLTDDANTGPTRRGFDLYRYDFDQDELVNISATPGGNGARVEGILGISEDGDRVYYSALGQVVPGTGTDGWKNLYLWEDDGTPNGTTRFIATLDRTIGDEFYYSSNNWSTGSSYNGAHKSSWVTPNGRFLLLQSQESLTGYDNRPDDPNSCPDGKAVPGPCTEIYRYDADAPAGGELVCVSCNPSGEPPLGRSVLASGSGGLTPRSMSDDGHYVFFNSDDALLPGDTNDRTDAYEWSEGELHLLSSGKSASHSGFVGSSADGARAFFATRSPLVPQDTDHNVDMYVANIDGGLASQQSIQLPSCEGEACRGAGTPPPPPAPPASASFNGVGNKPQTNPGCAKGKRKVKGRCVLKHKKRHAHKRHSKARSQRGGSK